MRWRLFIIAVSIFLILIAGVYARTTITDDSISARSFNMAGGKFTQETNILSEVGIIKDDSQGGEASYLDEGKSLFVRDGHAYTLSKDESALCIFDVNDPTNITEISCIQDDSLGGTATYLEDPEDVFVVGKYAYVGSRINNSLNVFDISDPTNITEVSSIQDVGDPSFSYSLTISGKYAYLLGNTPDGLYIFDISDPTNMTKVGNITDDSVGGDAYCLNEPRQLILQGDYAYVAAPSDDCVSILDVSDPTNITEVGYIQDEVQGGDASYIDGPQNIYVSGDYMYVVGKVDDSLTVVDTSNKSNPIEVNYIRDDSVGGSFSNLQDIKLLVGAGDYLFTSTFESNGSLCVFDISDPYDLEEIQCISTDSGEGFLAFNQTTKLFLYGNHIYVIAKGSDSLSIVEITGIKSPSVRTGSLKTTLLDVLGDAKILRDVYVGNGLNVAGTGLFSSGLSVYGTLKVIGDGIFTGNLTVSGNTGITGNYTTGNCWTAYSGGIIYATNCTSV